jgi:hypothetical protein
MSQELVGRTAESFEMVVELGKIREFARATKSRNPAYDGKPGDHPVSPGTFLMACEFWQHPEARAFFGVKRNFQRVLHGEQEFVFHGPPPHAGDVLVGTQRIDKVYEKPGKRGGSMIFTEMVTEFRDPDGRLVAETRNTTIETSKATTEK